MLHNLVFSLVKLGDHRYAKDIIKAEKLSACPDDLIEALSQVKKLKRVDHEEIIHQIMACAEWYCRV